MCVTLWPRERSGDAAGWARECGDYAHLLNQSLQKFSGAVIYGSSDLGHLLLHVGNVANKLDKLL